MVQSILDFLRSVFGTYEPITTAYYVDADTTMTVVAEGAAGVNFEYVSAVFLFAIVLYSLFRIIGTVISGRR